MELRFLILLIFNNFLTLTSSSEASCGQQATKYEGWITSCDNKALTADQCVAIGSHCAYCSWNSTEYTTKPSWAGCGYKDQIVVDPRCKFYYHNSRRPPCQEATTPEACVTAGNHCSWCTQPGFAKARCNTFKRLESLNCRNKYIETIKSQDPEVEYSLNNTNNDPNFKAAAFSIQKAKVYVRAGQSSNLNFVLQEPDEFPVDLFMAIDISYSMKTVLDTVKNTTGKIFDSFKNHDDVRIGFSTFIDKVQAPMTAMTNYKVWTHPWAQAAPPKLYERVAPLSKDKDDVQGKVQKAQVSANIDGPEAALSAMLQSVVCSETNWRQNSLKLLLVITESWFHHGGDGMGQMAGLVDKHPGTCQVDPRTDLIKFGNKYDYPSIAQVSNILRENDIIPIFALKQNFIDEYQMLTEQYFPNGQVSPLLVDSAKKLQANQEDLIQLIQESIKKIRNRQKLDIKLQKSKFSNLNGFKSSPFAFDDQICAGFKATQDYETENARVTIEKELDVGPSEKVQYNVKFSAKQDACEHDTLSGDYKIKTSRLSDEIDVEVVVKCKFNCQNTPRVLNSPDCSNKGTYFCGACTCNAGWTGPTCDDPVDACTPGNASHMCKAPHKLISKTNGQNICQCHQQGDYPITGACCQCDYNKCPGMTYARDAKTFAQNYESGMRLPCSGNGECMCEESTGTMYCKCHEFFTGPTCNCPSKKDTCIDPAMRHADKNELAAAGSENELKNVFCNGRGECECGSCKCEPGWTGPFCELCTEDCPSCDLYKSCSFQALQRRINADDEKFVQEKSINDDCKQNDFKVDKWVDPYNITESSKRPNATICSYFDVVSQCKYYFTYEYRTINGKEVLEIVTEEGGRCASGFDYAAIAWAFLAAMIVGILLLCCWQCLFGLISKITDKIPEPSVAAFVNTKTVVAKTSEPVYKAMIVRSGDVNEMMSVRWLAYKGERVTSDSKEQLLAEHEKSPRNRRNNDVIELSEMNRQKAHYEEWETGVATFQAGNAFSEIMLHLQIKSFKGRECKLMLELIEIVDVETHKAIKAADNEEDKHIARISNIHYKLPVHILRDDDPGQVGFAKPSYVFKESDACINLPLQRTMGSDGKMTVIVASRDITAIGGEDFIPINLRKYVFEDGDLLKYVTVDLIPRTKYREHHERSFAVEIIDVDSGLIAPATGSCLVNLISDNELANITFAKKVVPCLETDKSVKVTVYRTHNNEGRCEIKYRTIAITAKAGEDFQDCSDILVFENGDVEQTIEIPLYENKQQKDEGCTFKVALEDPGITSGVKIGDDGECLVTIIDDDVNGLFEFKHKDMVYRAGNNTELKVPIIRTMGRDADINIDYEISSDNVTGLEELKSGTVSFAHDEVVGEINLGYLSNLKTSEKSIKLIATLTHASKNGRINKDNKTCELTIYPLPEGQVFSFTRPIYPVFFCDGIVQCVVTRTGDLEKATSCTYETIDGTARSGVNYLGAKGVVIFDKNESQKEIMVPVLSGFFPDDVSKPLTFSVELIPIMPRSETGEVSTAVVEIDYNLANMPDGEFGLRPGQVMVQLGKQEVICRKSQKYERIPVRINEAQSEGQGKPIQIDWECVAVKNINIKKGVRINTHAIEEGASSDNTESNLIVSDILHANSKDGGAYIEVNVGDLDIKGASGVIHLTIQAVKPDRTCILGLHSCIITVLNDIDRGHLGWNHRELTCYSFTGLQDLRILRTGAADSDISVQVHATSDTDAMFPAIEGVHFSLPRSLANNMQRFPAKITDISIPVKLEHVTPSDAEYKMAPNKHLDQIERSFYLTMSNPIGGDIALAKVKITIVDHLGMNRINYLPVLSATSGRGVDDLNIQVVRSGTALDQKCTIPVSCGEFKGQVHFKANQISTYHKIPASIIADFAEAGQCHVVYEDSEKCLLPKEPQLVKITELIEPITIELSKPNFVAKKRDTHAIMHVHRTGSLDGRVKVKLENQDPHLFHESPELEVVFEEGQSVAPVKIALKSMAGVGRLAVKHAETDHRTRQANLGNNTVQQITILDEEEPSVIAIDTDNIQVDLDKKQINVPVLRCGGEDMVAVKYHTIEDTAQAGIHYLHQVAQIVFAEGENQTNFSIPIVTLPVEESVKLKVQLHSVQGNNASINPNFELVDVVIPGIEHSGVFDFTQPTYKVNQSSGKVLLEIQRQRGTRGHVTVPIAVQAMSEEDYLNKKELKSNKLNSQTYHCVFEDGQKIANVEINISQEAKTDLTQVLACTITDIVGENVEIGHQKNCHVEVTNDIDGGTIGFVNQKIEADALKDIRLKLDLNCTQPGNEVSCKWRIIGGKPLINYRSESSSGGRVQWPTVDAANAINVMLLNDPTGEDAEFIVELYDPSTGARIDEANSQCKIVVKNYVPDISVPVEQIIRVKQSEGMAIIPLQRSITQVGKLALKWSSVGDEAYKKTIGEIEFPEGQNDTLIKIPLLAEPQEMDKHEFTLKLEPLNDAIFNHPKIMPQIIVENDVGPGLLSFSKHEIFIKQSQDKIKLNILRKHRFMDACSVKYKIESNDKKCPYLEIPTPEIKMKENVHDASIEISMEEEPQDTATHEFTITLYDAENAIIDRENCVCHVTVENDISAGTVGFKNRSPMEIKQSKGVVRFVIRRNDTTRGVIQVPYIVIAPDNSPYQEPEPNMVTFKNGAAKATVEMSLPRIPMDNATDTFKLVLQKPDGGARLDPICSELEVTIVNDIITRPTDVQAGYANNDLVVQWKGCKNVKEYIIEYQIYGGNKEKQRITIPAHEFEETSDYYHILTNLKSTTNYILQVIAVGNTGTKEYSETVRFETIGISPDKPQRIAFQILGPGSLQVNWGEPPETNGQIISYEVAYGLEGQERADYDVVELPSGHNRSLLIEDLIPEQEYVYEVRAQNEWGWSETRRARLAIQLDQDVSPPSDYLMGRTSTIAGSETNLMGSGMIYEETTEDEAYEPLNYKFSEKQVLDYQVKMAAHNRSMHSLASVNEYVASNSDYSPMPSRKASGKITVKASNATQQPMSKVLIQGSMFGGSQDREMYGSTTFIQAEADTTSGMINTKKVVDLHTNNVGASSSSRQPFQTEEVTTRTETVTRVGAPKISTDTFQGQKSTYMKTQEKEKNLFGTTLLTTNRQHHTNYAMAKQIQEQQQTTTTTTTTVKKIRKIAGPEQGWDADCDSN